MVAGAPVVDAAAAVACTVAKVVGVGLGDVVSGVVGAALTVESAAVEGDAFPDSADDATVGSSDAVVGGVDIEEGVLVAEVDDADEEDSLVSDTTVEVVEVSFPAKVVEETSR